MLEQFTHDPLAYALLGLAVLTALAYVMLLILSAHAKLKEMRAKKRQKKDGN